MTWGLVLTIGLMLTGMFYSQDLLVTQVYACMFAALVLAADVLVRMATSGWRKSEQMLEQVIGQLEDAVNRELD